MKIRLESLEETEPFAWSEQLEVTPAELGDTEILELSPVAVSGTVSNRGSIGFHLEATIDYRQASRCTRCLRATSPVSNRLTFDVVMKVQADEPSASKDRELEERDFETVSLSEPEVETRPLVVEQLSFAVPMKYLCAEDCKGLCGQCGGNLNQSQCSCREAPDPRWAGLEALRAKS